MLGNNNAVRMLGAALFLGLSSCGPSSPAETRGPQHLFVITIDTLRADRLGCYGGARLLTPCMDALASSGTRFAEATAPMPSTVPSHSTLFTGLYPLSHGATSNFLRLPEEVTTLAEVLASEGFDCGAFFHTFRFQHIGVTQGFARIELDETSRAEQLIDRFQAWLEQAPADQRLFAWVHLFLPHAPLDPPARLVQQWVERPYRGALQQDFDTLEAIRRGVVHAPLDFVEDFRQRYDASVAYTDEKLKELLSRLQQRNLLENSLLVFAADHGESLENGVLGLHSPIIAQTTLHVPLMMVGPGIPAGKVVSEVVELVDVLPTVLDLLQLPALAGLQGTSLRPLLQGESEDPGLAFSMLPTKYFGLRKKEDPPQVAVRRGPWKMVRRGAADIELFQLQDDPLERRNVAAQEPGKVEELGELLDGWLAAGTGPGGGTEVDPETAAFLEQLGYTDESP
jgi:arylsulfatase A-like enzyme